MKKLLFFLPLFLLAEVNPFDVKITPQNANLLTPQEKAILQNRENIKKLQTKVDSLEKSINKITYKLVSYDETINNLNDKLQGFNTLLDEVNTAQNDIANLKRDVNQTKSDIEILKQKVASLENNVTAIQATLKEIIRVQQIQNQNIESLKNSIKVLITELKQKQITPKEAMKKAKEYFYAGKLDKAKELFLYTLSKRYLPATSSYYLGEIAFKKHQYDIALGYYKKSVEFYPKKTSFTDRLLYHTAISFEKLGNKQAAKLTLQKLIHDFPKSKYAALAKKELEKLK